MRNCPTSRSRVAPGNSATPWGPALAAILALSFTVGCQSPPPPQEPVAIETAPTPSPPPLFSHWLRWSAPTAASDVRLTHRYLDALLGHQVFQFPPAGVPASIARELLLDDDKLLLSTGRRLWGQEVLFQPGMAGKFCFLHSSFCLKRLFEVHFFLDGQPVPIYDNQYAIERFPSHTHLRYQLGPLRIDERKFITEDDRAVATYALQSADRKAHRLRVEVVIPAPALPGAEGAPGFPLLAQGSYQRNPIFLYVDAPGFRRSETGMLHLQRTFELPADGSATEALVALSFEDTPRAADHPGLSATVFEDHVREVHRWFAENVPFFDSSDAGFTRMWLYRWWLVRFNMTEANTPDLQGYRFYEGKLGFDNPITFAVPAQLKDLAYLRDPAYGLSQIENAYRNTAPSGAIVDPPGSPYWGETYSHWAAAAVLEFHRVHPIQPDRLRQLLPAMAADVRAWIVQFDPDGDGLPQSDRPRITGYDLDILSWWQTQNFRLDIHAQPPDLERVDFASFVHANALAVAELAGLAGNPGLSAEFEEAAKRLQQVALQGLWDDEAQFFFPRRAKDDVRIPTRELHGFFPFLHGLAPDEPRYLEALRKFVDPDEFWSRYPPVITSQAHYRNWTWEMDGLTRNIAPHPISMGARTLIQVRKRYHQEIVTPGHVMELLQRYNDLVYPGVNPYDPFWRPNAHEYYSKWEPWSSLPRPKPSDISHDFHSMFPSLVVEGAVGLTPRTDDRIELDPAALSWSHFLLDGLRYRGRDLTIAWDQPDGKTHYPGLPEGFSLAIDGKIVFTRQQLGHVIYDPSDDSVQSVNGPSPGS